MSDYPKHYLFSLDRAIDLIKRALYANIAIVTECLNFQEVLDYELEVAIAGEQWRWCYGEDKLEVMLLDLCPQRERRLALIKEIRQEVAVQVTQTLGGEPRVEHQYEYQPIDKHGGYMIIDQGDYRVMAYYRLLREQRESELEHGYIPNSEELDSGRRPHIRRVHAP